MAVIPMVLNGTNLTRDHGIQSMPSAILTEGVLQNFENELEVTTNQVDTGMCFVEVTRTTVTPNETFKVPVRVTAATVVDTTGTGWVIVKIDQAKVNDGSANAEDGTGIATVEDVTVLPSDPYVILATLASGVITDARDWSKISDYVSKNPIYYDEDVVGTDSYAITVNGIIELEDGAEFRLKVATSNTGAATLNVNGLGAKTIKRRFNQDFVTGDILAGQIIEVVYDADTDTFQMLSMLATEPASLDLATSPEALAGTDDIKYMSPLKVRESIDQFRLANGTAGETIDGSTTPQPLAIAGTCKRVIPIHTDGNNMTYQYNPGSLAVLNFADADASSRRSQSFDIPNDGGVWSLKRVIAYFACAGSPSGNIAAEVMTDAAGVPDNVVLTNGANTNTVAANSVPVAAANPEATEFTWSTSPTTPAGKYHLSFRKTTANDAANYLRIGYEAADNYASNFYSTYLASTTTWTAHGSNDLILILEFEVDYGRKLYKFDADDPAKANFAGFTTDSVVLDDPMTYILPGNLVSGFPASTFDNHKMQFGSTTPGVLTDTPSGAVASVIAPLGKPNSDTELVSGQFLKMMQYKMNTIKWSINSAKNLTFMLPCGFTPLYVEVTYRSEDISLSNDFQIRRNLFFSTSEASLLAFRNLINATGDFQASGTYSYATDDPDTNAPYVSVANWHENAVEMRANLATGDAITGLQVMIYGY